MDYKCLTLIFVFVSISAVYSAEMYTTRFDNIDLDEILKNQRLYKSYFDCLTNEGKCTPDGKELKDVLPDALATGCSKCNEKQKKGSEKVVRYVIKHKPDDYAKLEKMYDPEGIYKKKFEKEAREFGIPV